MGAYDDLLPGTSGGGAATPNNQRDPANQIPRSVVDTNADNTPALEPGQRQAQYVRAGAARRGRKPLC